MNLYLDIYTYLHDYIYIFTNRACARSRACRRARSYCACASLCSCVYCLIDVAFYFSIRNGLVDLLETLFAQMQMYLDVHICEYTSCMRQKKSTRTSQMDLSSPQLTSRCICCQNIH